VYVGLAVGARVGIGEGFTVGGRVVGCLVMACVGEYVAGAFVEQAKTKRYAVEK